MMKFGWISKYLLIALLACTSVLASETERRVKTRVAPAYPELMKKMRIGGSVKLSVLVAPDGHVVEARALGGHPMLVPSATDAVKRWKFESAAEQTTAVIEVKFDPTSAIQ